MALLPQADVTSVGVLAALSQVTTIDTFIIDDSQRHFLIVNNADTNPVIVTIPAVTNSTSVQNIAKMNVPDIQFTVPASSMYIVAEITPAYYNSSNSQVSVNFSSILSVTAAVYKVSSNLT